MYYLIGAGLILIISIILFIQARKKERQQIEDIVKKSEQEIEERTIKAREALKIAINNLQETQQQCKEFANIRSIEQARAQEARAATERLLQAEHERARAELNSVKQLEEERMNNEFKAREAALERQYQFKQQQFEEDFQVLNDALQDELNAVKTELDEFQTKRAAVNEAIRRERELEEKEDFYRISIKENDIKDIEVLRSIESRLTNREVLNKLIYEVFIKRPLMEMEKRVLKGQKIGGIYKITYIKTGEAYIGRSVDIGNRWKEHCLSSLNIGTIAHSTFHNILAEKGLQNFTWEVLEEVDKEKQSSREKYWVDFYQTNKQYNSKAGG